MEGLKLLPEFRMRDIRIGFSVSDRTLRTHFGTKDEAPVVVSLTALMTSLQSDGEVGVFRCRCKNSECDEAPSVRSGIDGDSVTWLVDVGDDELRYDLDRARATSEVDRVRGLIQSEIDRAHGRDFRFHPADNARLFEFPESSPFQGWYRRNSVAFLLSVAAVSAATTVLIRTFV